MPISRAPMISLIFLIALSALMRFPMLEQSPPGFYIDEAALSTHILCVQQTGSDAHGTQTPLFSQALGGGYLTPTYLYSGVLWTTLFGDSIAGFRSLAAFYSLLTLLGLFFLGYQMTKSKLAGALCTLTGALSPWGFQFARIAWDPAIAPCFMVWGIYFALRAIATATAKTTAAAKATATAKATKPETSTSPATSKRQLAEGAISGLLFSLAMYSYPPTRVQVALLLIPLTYFALKEKIRKPLIVAALTLFLTTLPLILQTLSGEIQGRFNMLSIASPYYTEQFGGFSFTLVTQTFVTNLFKHLSPEFLFIKGDTNLRHSIQTFGELSWLDALGLLCFIILLSYKPLKTTPKRFIYFALWGFIAGIVPAAMTWEAVPHALRAIGSWPMISLFTGLCLFHVTNRWKHTLLITLTVAAGFFISFSRSYFVEYPRISEAWFDAGVKASAQYASQFGNWDQFAVVHKDYDKLARDYYRMSLGRQSCKEARAAH